MIYTDFVKMLHVNKHRLDDELEVQADILHQIAEQLAKAGSKEIEAKEELAQYEASLFLELTKKDSTSKMTRDQADATIKTDLGRQRLWSAYQKDRHEHELWQGLYDAWKARGFDLKVLGQLYADDYFAIDSAGHRGTAGHREHERLRENAAEQRRPRRTLS